MIYNILKILVFVVLPLGGIAAAFGIWFDNWLIKKYPNTDSEKLNKIGTIAMISIAAILLTGFLIVMYLVT